MWILCTTVADFEVVVVVGMVGGWQCTSLVPCRPFVTFGRSGSDITSFQQVLCSKQYWHFKPLQPFMQPLQHLLKDEASKHDTRFLGTVLQCWMEPPHHQDTFSWTPVPFPAKLTGRDVIEDGSSNNRGLEGNSLTVTSQAPATTGTVAARASAAFVIARRREEWVE